MTSWSQQTVVVGGGPGVTRLGSQVAPPVWEAYTCEQFPAAKAARPLLAPTSSATSDGAPQPPVSDAKGSLWSRPKSIWFSTPTNDCVRSPEAAPGRLLTAGAWGAAGGVTEPVLRTTVSGPATRGIPPGPSEACRSWAASRLCI